MEESVLEKLVDELEAPKVTTHVAFLLDESGSMASILDDTLGGFNTYIDTLLEVKDATIKFTLVKFDTNKTEKMCVGVLLSDVPRLTRSNYVPGAGTPLRDAMCEIMQMVETTAGPNDRVVVVVQTDGHENSSRKITKEVLFNIIKEKTEKGWQFVYLGANIDTFDAEEMGVAVGTRMAYIPGMSKSVYTAAASNIASYAQSGSPEALNFTSEQRKEAGEDEVLKVVTTTNVDPNVTTK